MANAVRVVAADYDGTLTDQPRPRADVLAGIGRLRQRGLVVVLVTGRILGELRDDFPDVDDHFDLIVAENGAVVSRHGATRDLVAPVDPRLGLALAHRDVPVRHGRVLLACDATHAAVVLEEVSQRGLDCQLIRNRGPSWCCPVG